LSLLFGKEVVHYQRFLRYEIFLFSCKPSSEVMASYLLLQPLFAIVLGKEGHVSPDSNQHSATFSIPFCCLPHYWHVLFLYKGSCFTKKLIGFSACLDWKGSLVFTQLAKSKFLLFTIQFHISRITISLMQMFSASHFSQAIFHSHTWFHIEIDPCKQYLSKTTNQMPSFCLVIPIGYIAYPSPTVIKGCHSFNKQFSTVFSWLE